jgi:hypothetical protein
VAAVHCGPVKLSERDRRTLRALAATLLPEGGPLPSAEAVDAAGAVSAVIERLPAAQTTRLVGLIRTFSALPAERGRRRFRNLSPAARERVVGRLSAHLGYRGQMFNALKQLIVTTWASDPRVSAAIGDDGRCLADSPQGQALIAPLLPDA